MSLLAGQFVVAEEINEEEGDKNPLATFEDMERLLNEKGEKLSAQEKYQLKAWMEYFKSPIASCGRRG